MNEEPIKQMQKTLPTKQENEELGRLKRLYALAKRQGEENSRSQTEKLSSIQKDLNDTQQENNALKEQHIRLREFVKKAQEEGKNTQEELKKSRKELADAVNENVRLNQLAKGHSSEPSNSGSKSTEIETPNLKLSDAKQRVDQLERVIHFLRDRSEGAQLEAKQLREELQEAFEKIELLEDGNPSGQKSKDIDNKELRDEIHLLKEAATKTEQVQEIAAKDTIRQENQKLKEDNDKLRQQVDEKESIAKQAHQHLAKKVKETTILSEKIEEQKVQLLQSHHKLTEANAKISELQNILNMQQQQEKRIQDQLNEVLRSFDAQIQKWEEKYFQVYDKWQESELRNHSLRKLEEKHAQMQSMLVSLGTFIAPPTIISTALHDTKHDETHRLTDEAHRPIQDPFGGQLNRNPNKPAAQE